MFSISKKLTLAITMMAFCIGQVCASGPRSSNEVEDEQVQQPAVASAEAKDPRFGGLLPRGPMELIMVKAADKGTNPRHLAFVCCWWHDVLRENNLPQGELKYSAMNPFMQKCMQRYWERRFYDGALLYRPTPGNDEGMITMDIASLRDPFCDTFDLSTCKDRSNFVVITTDMKRFFEVGGKNQGRVVILFILHGLAAQKVKSTPNHPFASTMDGWNPDKAPVGIFWRWGNDANLTWCDYLTVRSLDGISSENLLENWKKACTCTGTRLTSFGPAGMDVIAFFMFVCKPKLELKTIPKV